MSRIKPGRINLSTVSHKLWISPALPGYFCHANICGTGLENSWAFAGVYYFRTRHFLRSITVPRAMLVGVYSPALTEVIAGTMMNLGENGEWLSAERITWMRSH